MGLTYSRRHALWLSAGLLVACRDRSNSAGAAAPAPSPDPRSSAASPGPVRPVATAGTPEPRPAASAATPSCIETHANIEGPYYRAGAPERASLVDAGMPGAPIVVEGRVTGLDCGRGLAGVELDVWHATHDGHYDNDGTMKAARDRFLLRGRLRTDADGRYRLTTIVPGRYLNGPQYRPAHIHVKVRSAGFAELTTQLYFPDDPFNDVDPFIHRSLVMAVEKSGDRQTGHFDFVLRRA